MSDREKSIEERLQAHPEILECVKAMLNIVEATSGHIDKANEAELLMTEQTRRIGKVALNDWANRKCEQKTKELLSQDDHIVPNGKKKSSGPQHTANKKLKK